MLTGVTSCPNPSSKQILNEVLQQDLNKDNSLMRKTASKLRDGEDNAKQKDEVYDELKSELNTPRKKLRTA